MKVIDIENLILTKNAIFYKKNTCKKTQETQETQEIISNLIEKACINKTGTYILNKIERNGVLGDIEYKYSIRIFKVNKKVNFIKETDLFDQVIAFILIIEIGDYIVVFSKNNVSISKGLKENFKLVKNLDFASRLTNETEYKKLTLRNMTISDKDIITRSYEAKNLNGLLSLYSAGRSIPSYIKARVKEKNLSLSSTGRISEDSNRIGIEGLVIWIQSQITLLKEKSNNNEFISNFARDLELYHIPKNLYPTAVLLEYNNIHDYINLIETTIFKIKNGKNIEINEKMKRKIFCKMEDIYDLDKNLYCKNKKDKLRKSTNNFSIQSKALKKYYIEERGVKSSLQEIINRKKYFSITFNDPNYMYFMGRIYQVNPNTSDIKNVLYAIEEISDMANVKSEKGNIKKHSKNFQKNSLFSLIEKIHKKDNYIFCDDLGNEWADHITINNKKICISFIHSKYKEDISNSASNLHDIIGQAIKNLGNMHFSEGQFLKKKTKFTNFYEDSQIPRIRKGKINNLDSDLENLLRQHSLHRKCIIACPFLSKKNIEDEFNNFNSGKPVRGNIIQLLWILSSFIHAAKEIGVIPIIYCRP